MTVEHFLRDAVVVLAALTLVVLVCHRFRIPSVVGFLLTGVLIGPSGLRWVPEREAVEVFAEIGVVFLLFSIGLEFSLERLRQIRRAFFLGGSIQSLLTIALAGLLALLAGLDLPQAVFWGFLTALSSTAIVLKLYHDRREMEAPQGKLAIGILLFQDFLIVPMIVLTPVLGGSVEASTLGILFRFVTSLFVVAMVFLVARYLMPRLLHHIVATGVREILVLGSLAVCLAMAWLTESLGFSLALGAFIAGIIISESEYSHQVIAEVIPFRDVFNSVFFISIGMLLNVQLAGRQIFPILGLTLAILVGKALVAGAAVAFLGYPFRTVAIVGLSLAQVGEFSFVLLQLGDRFRLLPPDLYQSFLAASVLTMLLTPALVQLAPLLAARTGSQGAGEEPVPSLRDHVVIVGFGLSGRNLARVLKEASISYVIIELSGESVRRALRDGEPVLFGDATRRDILEHAGIARARVAVFAISDLEAVRRSIQFARHLNPGLHIIVRTRMVAEIEDLRRHGADQVFAEEFETSIEIFTHVLEQYHVPRNVIRTQTRALRGEDYRMLRTPAGSADLSEALLRILAAGTVEIFRLEPASPAVGQTIRELALRKRTGTTIIAVVRGDTPTTNPGADLRLETGDHLVLVGSHEEIERAFLCLEPSAAVS